MDAAAAAAKAVDLCCSRQPQAAAAGAVAAALVHPPLADLMLRHARVRALQLRELGSGLSVLVAGLWNNVCVGRGSGGGGGDMFKWLTVMLREAEKEECVNR